MIDFDDVGDGFLFGGIIVGIIFLLLYLAFSKPEIDACKEKGGIMVKTSDGESACIDKTALIAKKDKK